MGKLEVKESKRLKLVGVLIKQLNNITMDDLSLELRKFNNLIEINHIKTRGPIVTRCYGTNVDNTGDVTFNYDIMVQTTNKIPNIFGFTYREELIIDNCLYLRFKGQQKDLIHAQSKLDLYIWENELIARGDEYIVHVDSSHDFLTTDIFRPLEI